MLYRNDVFHLDQVQYRLLEVFVSRNEAWIISLNSDNPWPQVLDWSAICGLVATPGDEKPAVRRISEHMQNKRNQAWARVEQLVLKVPEIFEPQRRNAMVKSQAREAKCSERTIHKDLRRYWQGGQSKAALLPDYHNCGHYEGNVSNYTTSGRGGKPKAGHGVYQITSDDVARMHSAIEGIYLKDKRISIAATYLRLLRTHYTVTDGNGKRFIRPLGEHPSLRQFQHFLKKNYSLEQRLRAREGDKDFERDHRQKLGTVAADCQGIGHYYEIDATIVDLYGVSTSDINIIVGKPTLYLIIDRKSRLIVGFYLGFEHPSWSGAMEAICSISADKQALCARFGVDYDPEDWPAHEVYPREFLADRGSEMTSKNSNQICDDIQIGVTNLPSQRADWKPLVECGFKLIQTSMQDVAPGFDPPENAMRRQGKKYDKDACLNLKQLGKVILEAIIARNRKPSKHFELSLSEIAAGFVPSPINIWNHDIVHRSGALSRFPESRVRRALLPRDEASVTEEGIVFKGVYYTCAEAISRGWFIRARKKRFRTLVSYDARLADCIYVHDRNVGGEPYLATLTARSEKYRGLSFAEIKVYEGMHKSLAPSITETRHQVEMEFHEKITPTIDRAKKDLKRMGGEKSRSSRRKDTKEAREMERRTERQETAFFATHEMPTQTAKEAPTDNSKIIKFSILKNTSSASTKADSGSNAITPATEKTTQQKAMEARRRMLNGY
jgi:phage shock protein PspC (stress-responsive transcriptional regulator)